MTSLESCVPDLAVHFMAEIHWEQELSWSVMIIRDNSDYCCNHSLGSSILSPPIDKVPQLHPDIDPSNPDLHKKFVRLNEAYSVLSKSDSRRQYDNRLRLRQAEPFRETSGAQRDRGSDLNSRPGHGFEDEQQRYWEQFHQPSASQQAAFHSTQRRSRNLKVFGYCIFIMLAGVFVHYIGFR
eukprot:gi/632987115/ref/XP_007910612.1/ PREDICTED: dnaJ homolog subfamily C member 4 [Callorhinchus milii]